jgi:RNA polymerase-binding transcription factor DksA
MTLTDLATFQEVLRRKQAELTKTRGLESIAIERSADEIEEADYKSTRELAIAGLYLEPTARRSVASALARIRDGRFGTCVHCASEISRRRLEAVPRTPFCIVCQEAADRGGASVLESLEPAFLDAA